MWELYLYLMVSWHSIDLAERFQLVSDAPRVSEPTANTICILEKFTVITLKTKYHSFFSILPPRITIVEISHSLC